MDLGISGRKAIVCAASKGLGRGCAMALAREGVELLITARGRDALEATADDIRAATGGRVATLAGDVATDAGRAAIVAAMPDADILVNNAGGPPPGDYLDWSEREWHMAVEANMVAPIMLMKALVPAMSARGFGRVVNITSSAVKAPIATLGLSNGARGGLTGFVAGLSRKVARHGVTINNLLPGPFDTDRLRSGFAGEAKARGVAADVVRQEEIDKNPSRRLGTADEFGAVCAFLCSVHAGYMTGQNVLLDGGRYPGTM